MAEFSPAISGHFFHSLASLCVEQWLERHGELISLAYFSILNICIYTCISGGPSARDHPPPPGVLNICIYLYLSVSMVERCQTRNQRRQGKNGDRQDPETRQAGRGRAQVVDLQTYERGPHGGERSRPPDHGGRGTVRPGTCRAAAGRMAQNLQDDTG